MDAHFGAVDAWFSSSACLCEFLECFAFDRSTPWSAPTCRRFGPGRPAAQVVVALSEIVVALGCD